MFYVRLSPTHSIAKQLARPCNSSALKVYLNGVTPEHLSVWNFSCRKEGAMLCMMNANGVLWKVEGHEQFLIFAWCYLKGSVQENWLFWFKCCFRTNPFFAVDSNLYYNDTHRAHLFSEMPRDNDKFRLIFFLIP